MRVKKAQYVKGASDYKQCIVSDIAQIAIAGKSNVGKSSFINMLANRKKLARVSQQPGRTRLVNYFDFGSFILADLPGYGYARVSKAEKIKWAKMLDDFFADKANISHVFALCDIRHDPTADDVTMINYLYCNTIPFTVVATKADKLSRSQVDRSLTRIAAVLKCGKGDIIATSAVTRLGLENLLDCIERVVSFKNSPEEEPVDEEDT